MPETEEDSVRNEEVKSGLFSQLEKKKLSKEREPTELQPLEAFIAAAEEYGVEGLTHEILQDGREMMTQPKGEGWKALGADWTLFIGLTPEGEGPHNNTLLKDGDTYREITPGEKGKIGKDHPVAILVSKLSEQRKGIQAHLIGNHTDWEKRESDDQVIGTELEVDEEGNLTGNIPVDQEMKLMVEGAQFGWADGPEDGKQSLILDHSEE